MNTIGNRLRQMRGTQTLKDWAAQMHVHWNTIRNYENGRNPPASFLARVAEATGCSSDWLIFGRNPPLANPEVSEPIAGETSIVSSKSGINELEHEVFLMLTVFHAVKHFCADQGLEETDQEIAELTSQVLNSLQGCGVTPENPPSSSILQALIAAIYALKVDHINPNQVAERVLVTADGKRTALK